MATPDDDSPRSGVAPPQADDRLAGDGRHPQNRKAERGEEERPVGRSGWLAGLTGGKSGTQGLLVLGGVGAVVLLVIGGMWSWTVGRHPQGVPVIGPPPYPVKDHPADPGGMMIMGDDTTRSDVTGRGAVHLAPPPEQPDASLLAGRMAPHREDEGAGGPAGGHAGADSHIGEARVSRPPAAKAEAGGGAGHPRTDEAKAAKVARDRAGHDHEEAARERAGHAGEGARHAAAARDHAAAAEEKGHGQEPRLPLPHQAPLAAPLSAGEARRESHDKDGQTGARAGSGHSQAEQPRAAEPRAAEPRAAQSQAVQAQADEAGRHEVQLAALQNEEQARQEWTHLRHRLPDLLGGYEPVFRTVERGGKSFVRLRIGGFIDRAAARQLCAQLHAQAQACSVVAD